MPIPLRNFFIASQISHHAAAHFYEGFTIRLLCWSRLRRTKAFGSMAGHTGLLARPGGQTIQPTRDTAPLQLTRTCGPDNLHMATEWSTLHHIIQAGSQMKPESSKSTLQKDSRQNAHRETLPGMIRAEAERNAWALSADILSQSHPPAM